MPSLSEGRMRSGVYPPEAACREPDVPMVVWWVHPPGCTPTIPPWVHHAPDHAAGVHSVSAAVCAPLHWAGQGALGSAREKPVGSASFRARGRGKCQRSYAACAQNIPRARRDRMKDWIARGGSLGQGPRERHVAQRGLSSPTLLRDTRIPALGSGNLSQGGPARPRDRMRFEGAGPWALTRPLNLWQDARSVGHGPTGRPRFARREGNPGGREGQGALPPGLSGCALPRKGPDQGPGPGALLGVRTLLRGRRGSREPL